MCSQSMESIYWLQDESSSELVKVWQVGGIDRVPCGEISVVNKTLPTFSGLDNAGSTILDINYVDIP